MELNTEYNKNNSPSICAHKSEKSFFNCLSGASEMENSSSQKNDSLSTQQKLNLNYWGLPKKILEFYKKKGITHMFQWQLECLTLNRVLDSGNLVYSAPTSAGKTLVAEILISKCILELQKKALVILPFVSVVREKMFYFQEMYTSNGIIVEGYMGGHSPSVGFKQVNLGVCTIEKANSIVNKLLEEQGLGNVGLIVIDELHLLGDSYRGYILELLLTKLKYISSRRNIKIQIVGMSATLPNLKSLADWLNADVYYTNFRPVPLQEKLKCSNFLYDKQLNKLSELTPLSFESFDDSENVGQLCLETIKEGHSVLIFCPTKIWCEKLAEKIALFFQKIKCNSFAEIEETHAWVLKKQLDLMKINDMIEHLKMSPVGLDKDLYKVVTYGVAFHHAGLTLDERDIIEGSFRKGAIRVLCATSTLSSGVNLPARRVIIRSPMSFGGLMDTLTYRQMIGRAGRMGVDTEGESILICKPNEKSMCKTLMSSNLKPIESCLGHGKLSASLKRALLEVIASGIVANPNELKKYANCTFLAFTSRLNIEDPIKSCIDFLEENEFIRLQDNGNIYVPTPLAKACLSSSLPPDEGLALFRELQRARRCFVLDTDLHIIYQVTPYSVSEQWSKVDWLNVLNILEGLPANMKRVGEMVGVEESFLVRIVKGSLNPNSPEHRNKLAIHRRFYTSLALQDLINEVPLSVVADKYECNKGMLQSLQQSAATYAGMVTEFTKHLGWSSIELIFSVFQERLQFGIQRELSELMRLPLLNAIRARALFNAGFINLSTIANANVTDLENVFFAMAPFQSKKEIAGETSYEKEQRNKLETIWITGKSDLTIRQAAELMIAESRNILELEFGLESVLWGKKDNLTLVKNDSIMDIDTKMNKIVEISNHSKNNSHTLKEIENETNNKSRTVIKVNPEEGQIICDKSSIKNRVNEINLVAKENSIVKSILNNENTLKEKWSTEKDLTDYENNKEIEKPEEKNNLAVYIDSVNEEKQSLVQQSEVIDYFTSSFNFEIVPDYKVFEKNNSFVVIDDAIGVDSMSIESDSNSSIEIVFDSTMHSSSKNLSFSRLSEDMFENTCRGKECRKNMSTPNAHHSKIISNWELDHGHLADTKSPDLFSQSLTFDTQMGKILDLEECSAEDFKRVIHPSSSFNSDDLGFVSDLSPPKSKQVHQADENKKVKEQIGSGNFKNVANNFFGLKDFKTPKTCLSRSKHETKKRKINAVNSPDIMDFNEHLLESQHNFKRIKYSLVEEENDASLFSSKEVESDDEILPTPKFEKGSLSNIPKLSISRNSFTSTFATSTHKTANLSFSKQSPGLPPSNRNTITLEKPRKDISENQSSKINWDKVNIIDVCETEQKFRIFYEQLKRENIVGLALGCRKKTKDKKNIIGMKVTKKTNNDNGKENYAKCFYKDVVLDGMSFYWEGNSVYYMSMEEGNIPLEKKINLLKSLNVKSKVFRVFDCREQLKMLLRCCSVLLSSCYQDPKVGFWLLSENFKEKNFSSVVLEYLPASRNLVLSLGSIIGYSSPGLFVKTTTSHKTRSCLEAFLTYHVVSQQLPLLRLKGLLNTFEKAEMPLMECLAKMESVGFQICQSKISKVMFDLETAKEALEEKAYLLAGHNFSMSSSVALSKVLCKILGLEEGSMVFTKKRKTFSTNKEALQKLANETKHPLPEIILEWRKIRSILTKFVLPLLHISSDSTRVFGVSQVFTVTGRISMHEPNLQNIPKEFFLNYCDPPKSISIRDVFVASENCVLMSVDYCQIELRMLAHLSQDLNLITSIKQSSDIFVSIASTIYGIPQYEIDDNIRQKAKQTCYGIIYGIGSQNLSKTLKVSETDAITLINDFKVKYKGVVTYLKQTVEECRRKGYVTTLLGRRRYLPAINNSNHAIRMEAERQAINTVIQGSAADLLKTAIVKVDQKVSDILSEKVNAHLVLHLHDELIFEIDQNIVDTMAGFLKDTMENAMELGVPIPVKIKVGSSWGQLNIYCFSGD